MSQQSWSKQGVRREIDNIIARRREHNSGRRKHDQLTTNPKKVRREYGVIWMHR